MGCSMGHTTAVRKDMKERGYSTEHFMNDYLVPVDCFACVLPPKGDEDRARAVAQELVDYSAACGDFYADRAVGAKTNEGKPKVPAKAFCLFRLLSIDIDQAGGGTLDLSNAACKLGVRLRGGILVPSTADWLTHPRAPAADALQPAAPEYGQEAPMMLNVEVWGLIHKPQSPGVHFLCGDGGHGHSIIVQAKRVIFDLVGQNGDPMVQSWLPIEDLLTCMTVSLTGRLKVSMGTSVDEGDYT